MAFRADNISGFGHPASSGWTEMWSFVTVIIMIENPRRWCQIQWDVKTQTFSSYREHNFWCRRENTWHKSLYRMFPPVNTTVRYSKSLRRIKWNNAYDALFIPENSQSQYCLTQHNSVDIYGWFVFNEKKNQKSEWSYFIKNKQYI